MSSRRWISLGSIAALFAAGIALRAADPASLRPLVNEADCVLEGAADGAYEVGAGILHAFSASRTLWGESAGDRVLLFTPRADVPDSPRIESKEVSVVGIRWVDRDSEPWADRLRSARSDSVAPRDLRVGVVAQGGVIALHGREGLADEIAAWIEAQKNPGDDAGRRALLVRMLEHSVLLMKNSALEALADPALPLDAQLVSTLSSAAAREMEMEKPRGAFVRGWIDLVQLRSISAAEPVLRSILLSGGDEALRTHASEAFARIAAPEERRALAASLDTLPSTQGSLFGAPRTGKRRLAEHFLDRWKQAAPSSEMSDG